MEKRLGLAVVIRMFCRLDGATISIAQRYSWSPADFGQARMAAMGWLVGLAQKQGTPQVDEVVASFRKPAEKRPADLRALWDWLYLCSVRLDYAGALRGRPRARAARRRPTRSRSGRSCIAWEAGRPPPGQTDRRSPSSGTQEDNVAAARQGRARSRARLLPRRSRPAVPSWPRPRSSRTSTTS